MCVCVWMRAFGKPHVASKFIETFERPRYWQRRGEEKTFNDQKEEEFSKGIYMMMISKRIYFEGNFAEISLKY